MTYVICFSAGIQSIINLQTPGEHASCGPPLDPSGFSYNPQTFMDNDSMYNLRIFFFLELVIGTN